MNSPNKIKLGCLALAAVCEILKRTGIISVGAEDVYQFRELLADLAEIAPWMARAGWDLTLYGWTKVRECTNWIRQLFT